MNPKNAQSKRLEALGKALKEEPGILEDLLGALGSLSGMIGNYDERLVAVEKVDGLEVSTVAVTDCLPEFRYETAVIDELGVHPVERYASKEEAEAGHARWVVAAPSLVKVQELLYRDKSLEHELARGGKNA